MFKKVLIAEDFDSINIALIQTLENMGVTQIEHAKYCDDALLKAKKALQDNSPFDLLISDLSFETDYRTVTIASGEELIAAIRLLQPSIPVLVYTVEDKSFVVKSLVEDLHVNAFVHKGRNSISQIKTAMETNLTHALKENAFNEIEDYDEQLLLHLSNGDTIEEIEQIFKNQNIKPNSKSYIEKRISKLKDIFKAKTTIHLVSLAKDMGII
jgi:two-component system, NarL family, captular synthesis response regulator RcsB